MGKDQIVLLGTSPDLQLWAQAARVAVTAGRMARWGPAQRGQLFSPEVFNGGGKGPHLSRWSNGFLSPKERRTGGKGSQEPSVSLEIHGSLNPGKVILRLPPLFIHCFYDSFSNLASKNGTSTSHVPGPQVRADDTKVDQRDCLESHGPSSGQGKLLGSFSKHWRTHKIRCTELQSNQLH